MSHKQFLEFLSLKHKIITQYMESHRERKLRACILYKHVQALTTIHECGAIFISLSLLYRSWTCLALFTGGRQFAGGVSLIIRWTTEKTMAYTRDYRAYKRVHLRILSLIIIAIWITPSEMFYIYDTAWRHDPYLIMLHN